MADERLKLTGVESGEFGTASDRDCHNHAVGKAE